MRDLIRYENGEPRIYENSEYIPAYLMLPVEIVAMAPKHIMLLPRTARELLTDPQAIRVVEDKSFRKFIMQAYGALVWTHMGLKDDSACYCPDDPAYRLAFNPGFWVQALEEYAGMVDPQTWAEQAEPDTPFAFVSLDFLDLALSYIVPDVMENHNMQAAIDTAREYRCFEDFSRRRTRRKEDFFRKWYHTRSKHAPLSLEQLQEDHKEATGRDLEFEDTTVHIDADVTGKIQVEQFMATLEEKDRQILQLRMEGLTLEEIAERLGYQNHSGVLKRIRKIGRAYERFADVDFGFREEKIV